MPALRVCVRFGFFRPFPGLSNLVLYHVDEIAGLVRYYFYDTTPLSFADAIRKRLPDAVFFGKKWVSGRSDLRCGKERVHEEKVSFVSILAISDEATEGQWLVMSGPREGLLFWDHTNNQFGPGAAGSGWSALTEISG